MHSHSILYLTCLEISPEFQKPKSTRQCNPCALFAFELCQLFPPKAPTVPTSPIQPVLLSLLSTNFTISSA